MDTNRQTVKRERFVRLAEARVEKAIRALRVIGNLANRNNYEYTDRDVQKIHNALVAELANLKAQFRTSGGEEAVRFKLDN